MIRVLAVLLEAVLLGTLDNWFDLLMRALFGAALAL